MTNLCVPYANLWAEPMENDHFQAVLKLLDAWVYSEMSTIHFTGSLTFTKDLKTTDLFNSMQNFNYKFEF